MRKRLFTAMLALAVAPGFSVGGDEFFSSSRELLPTSVPPSQGTVPPSAVNVESAPRTGVILDGKPGPDACEPCAKPDWVCGPPSCFWVSGEYLMWWIKDSQLPPLITIGVPGATPLPGVLGQPGTSVLFGGGDVSNQMREGGRVSGGFWLNHDHSVGVEASYFFLAARSVNFNGVSSGVLGSTMIARPFFDVTSGIQNAQLVAFPGIASGRINVSSSSRLQGADINLLCIPCCKPCCEPCPDPCPDQTCCPADAAKHKFNRNTGCGGNHWVSFLGGFRYLQLDEGLGIVESSQVNPALPAGPPLFGGSNITIADQFDTHNYFYGPQIGAKAECCYGRMFVNVRGKVAVGVTHQVLDIRGQTVIASPNGTIATTPAGFLASGSNSGHFTRDAFAVVPELGANVGGYITPHLRAFVGYTFLYWSEVARPGDQVDVGLSGTQIPTDARFNPAAGPARPAVLFRETDFWAQGINFGLEFRY